MTAFTADNIIVDGMYVMYGAQGWQTPTAERKFIARFKHTPRDKPSFISFLKKNFTVEEYFAEIEQSGTGHGPLTVLMAKGYLQPHIKKALKRLGYTVDQSGFKAMIDDQVKATRARLDAAKATA